jgi:hypothetical protein
MARISSYTKDTTPNDNDLLVGSEYQNTINGIDNFITKSYKLSDLAGYFASFQITDDQLYSFAQISQKVDVNISDIEASTLVFNKSSI